ncbi:MAG: Arc family DNA-binding protein [Dehalococcoidia bacterium]|nr:Arc family DNA-binding protein [Dehalococcoidia bacterium]
MGTVHVRRLDDEVVDRLKRRAAENNRSLESEVRHILEQAAEDDVSEKARRFGALVKWLRGRTWSHPQTPSHILIREDRDNRDGPE